MTQHEKLGHRLAVAAMQLTTKERERWMRGVRSCVESMRARGKGDLAEKHYDVIALRIVEAQDVTRGRE